jgi:hypothetical protein
MGLAVHPFDRANAHALTAIVSAGAARRIVACHDIVDTNGHRLWAKDQPVSPALQQRLFDRPLARPIESALRAEDGVSAPELTTAAGQMLAADDALASALAPWIRQLLLDIAGLPIHPVAQLLLTVDQVVNPRRFEHAVRAMLVAGALSLDAGDRPQQRTLAMLGGLLHDLGELYVDPAHLHPDAVLTPENYRHLVVHPRIGELLLATLTDYPVVLARAVGEHHERHNGSGYPLRSGGHGLSAVGKRLSEVEAIMGIAANGQHMPWTRVNLALRLVPGEFSVEAQGFALRAASQANEAPAEPMLPEDVLMQGQMLHMRLHMALALARPLATEAPTAGVGSIAGYVAEQLASLEQASDALLLDTNKAHAGSTMLALALSTQEISYRLDAIMRRACWSQRSLSADDEQALAPLWACLANPSARRRAHAPAGAGPIRLAATRAAHN